MFALQLALAFITNPAFMTVIGLLFLMALCLNLPRIKWVAARIETQKEIHE